MESKGDILVWPFRKKSLTKDLSSSHTPEKTTPEPVDVPYDIKTYITEINTGIIDTNYINSSL